MDNISIDFVAIRAVHKAEERERAIRAFNQSLSHLVLFTSLRTSATALNLQEGGSDMMFLDVGGN